VYRNQKVEIYISFHPMESITVNVHDGDAPTQHNTVAATDPIHKLHTCIPGGSRRLIVFKGYVRMVGFTFKYHGIKDGDDLYVVRPKSHPKAAHQSPSHGSTLQNRVFSEIYSKSKEVGTLSLIREAGRLTDLSQWRAQIRSSAIESLETVQSPTIPPTDIQESPALTRLNTDPLPRCW
jgi:hypothetical protein